MKNFVSSIIILIFFLGLIAGLHYLLFAMANNTGSFRISEVGVISNSVLGKSEIVNLSGIVPGQSVFDVDLKASAQRILSHSLIDSVEVTRVPMSRIAIMVVERKPVVAVSDGNTSYICDREGNVLNAGFLDNLPLIKPSFGITAGIKRIEDEILLLTIRNVADFKQKDRIGMIRIKTEGMYITLRDLKPTLFFIGKKPPNHKDLGKVMAIADTIKAKKLKIKYVDIQTGLVNDGNAIAYE